MHPKLAWISTNNHWDSVRNARRQLTKSAPFYGTSMGEGDFRGVVGHLRIGDLTIGRVSNGVTTIGMPAIRTIPSVMVPKVMGLKDGAQWPILRYTS